MRTVRRISITRVAAPALLVAVFVVACSSSSATAVTPKKDAGFTDGRTHDYPSFVDDVMPAFETSCTQTSCHGSKESNLNIFIPPDPALAYPELLKTSPTTGMKFVAPGDPDHSYVVLKIEGKQTMGTEMPPNDTGLPPIAPSALAAIRAWIAAGAQND